MLQELQNQFLTSTVGGLVIGSIYALMALGYTMVYGVLRLINFAHSEIFMIGTFAVLGTLHLFGMPSNVSGFALIGLLIVLAVAGAVASGGSAVILEYVAYR